MPSGITTTEFKNRLGVLCLKGGHGGLPRKSRDQHILFKSITLMLETGREYTETELNESLANWLSLVGQTLEIDHASLRRYLVDAGYISRDAAGRSYRVVPGPVAGLFEVGIESLDPVAVVDDAYREAEERKQKYLEKRAED